MSSIVFFSGGLYGKIYSFGFQGREEGFAQCIAIAVAGAVQRLPQVQSASFPRNSVDVYWVQCHLV
jgi:hypothetical protein